MTITTTTLLNACPIEGKLPKTDQLFLELQATPIPAEEGSFIGEIVEISGDEDFRKAMFGLGMFELGWNAHRYVTIRTCGADMQVNDRVTVLFERFESGGIRQLMLQHRRMAKDKVVPPTAPATTRRRKSAGGNGAASESENGSQVSEPSVDEKERKRLRNRFTNMRSARMQAGTMGDNPRARLKTIIEFEFNDMKTAAKALKLTEAAARKPFETKGPLPRDSKLVECLAGYFSCPRGLPKTVFMDE